MQTIMQKYYAKITIMQKYKNIQYTFLSILTHFIITYHISLVNIQTNYCNNNLLILDKKQLNKIMKFC